MRLRLLLAGLLFAGPAVMLISQNSIAKTSKQACQWGCNKQCHGAKNKAKCVAQCRRACR